MEQKLNTTASEKLSAAYEQYYENLCRFCFLKLKNEEQTYDCVQESFCVFYDRILQGEEIVNVGGYLYKIADNLVKAQWRKNKREQNILQLEEIKETLVIQQKFDFSDTDYDVLAQKVLTALDEKELEIYKLKYIEKKSINEIAQKLGISFSAAAKRLSRMRMKTKELITLELEGGE